MTTVAIESPEMIRLRGGKLDASGGVPTADAQVLGGSLGGGLGGGLSGTLPGPLGNIGSSAHGNTQGTFGSTAVVRPYVDASRLDTVGVVVGPPARDPRDAVLPPRQGR